MSITLTTPVAMLIEALQALLSADSGLQNILGTQFMQNF
jgi:hypothetical protein